MTRFFSAFLGALCLVFAPATASAQQTSVEDARVLGAWNLEVSQHTQQIVSIMEVINQGYAISTQTESGSMDVATAWDEVAQWRQTVETVLADYAAEADRLTQGPDVDASAMPGSVQGMLTMPGRSVETARNYFAVVELFVVDTLEGRSPDPNLTTLAQFNVIQAFLSGVAQTNQQGALTIGEDHPQRHLLNAMTANTQAFILVIELARQSYGAAPSHHAVDDIPAEIERLGLVSSGALGLSVMAHRTLASQINALSAEQLGVSAQARNALVALMATYPQSIEAENSITALLSQGVQMSNAAEDPDGWAAFMNELTQLETRRDALQVERQRLVSEM